MSVTETGDPLYEYHGALRPKNLRLRVIPTGPSEVEGGLFDAILVFAKGPENTRHEPYELALEVQALRGSKITPLGPDSIDTRVLQPGPGEPAPQAAYPDIEVQALPERSPGEVLSRYVGWEQKGIDRILPAPTHWAWVILGHNYVQVCDKTEDGSRVLAECRWRPRGKIAAMKG